MSDPARDPPSLATDRDRLVFLGRVSEALLAPRTYEEILQHLADLAVPRLGDWCAINIVNADGSFARLAAAHRDPDKVHLALDVWERWASQPADSDVIASVVRSGKPELVAEIPEGLLVASEPSSEHLDLLRRMCARSYVVFPLTSMGKVVGTLTLVHAESDRRYTESDLATIEEFARLAALAVEHARLFWREKEARLRAEASETQLRTFIDNLPELAWTALPDGYIDHYNARWYEYTGTNFEEMQGWGWEKVHDPALLPKVVERWKHSLATGTAFEMEFTLRGVDGVARWFLTRVAPMRDGTGQIVRWFGTNTNIDAIKVAHALSREMALQSQETAQMLLEMRAAKEQAEAHLAEHEAAVRRPR